MTLQLQDFEIPFTIIAGKLCYKYTKELVIAGGYILGASRWLIMPFIHDSRLMFLLQILHAITICTLSVCFASYVSSIVDSSKRGAFFWAFYAIGSIGSITGPALVGWIGGRNGLPAVYEVLGFVGVICGLTYLAIYFIKRKIESENSSDMFRKILERIDG